MGVDCKLYHIFYKPLLSIISIYHKKIDIVSLNEEYKKKPTHWTSELLNVRHTGLALLMGTSLIG